jgi:SAM-dependent methyltransferase
VTDPVGELAGSEDIFAGQPTPPEALAELYDLEHDDVADDLVFYRELAVRAGGARRARVLDLGCGSGRLLGPLLDGGARQIVGIDGSTALLARAEHRAAGDALLAEAVEAGRIELVRGDIRHLRVAGRFSLIIAVGVLPHLDGPAAVGEMLRSARSRLTSAGRLVLDDLGPGQMPTRDLPLSMDWRRAMGDRQVTRHSRLLHEDEAGGVRVTYSTLTEIREADGTIARLPAGYRLWYPSPDTLERRVEDAGLVVELSYGSHELDPLGPESDRRIFIVRRSA